MYCRRGSPHDTRKVSRLILPLPSKSKTSMGPWIENRLAIRPASLAALMLWRKRLLAVVAISKILAKAIKLLHISLRKTRKDRKSTVRKRNFHLPAIRRRLLPTHQPDRFASID